jgi:exodeoxyribonuclease VII small subunit
MSTADSPSESQPRVVGIRAIPEETSYEAAMSELRQVVDKLERGNLSLDDSLDLYERGVQLSQFCENRLVVVDERVTLLTQTGLQVRPNVIESAIDKNGERGEQ